MIKRMLGLSLLALLVVPAGAMAETHIITQSGITFSPSEITINLGDTVQWNWTVGAHTVTSGIDNSDPNAGDLFDSPLDAANPIFSFTFTAVGDQPFFCRPHADMGMTGVIHVTEVVPVEPAAISTVKALY